MTQTPARRQFKRLAGNVNHFLITILIGLDAVRAGTAERSESFSTSWQPHNVVRSADRSSDFAVSALMSWLIDALDSYALRLNRKPFLLQDVASRQSFGSLSRSVAARSQWMAERFGLTKSRAYGLSVVAMVWRNRLVHSGADNEVPTEVQSLLRESSDEISEEYQGLSVDLVLHDVGRGLPPRFKEATAMVRAVQQFVEEADSALLESLSLETFLVEALQQYVAADPASRVGNVWGKDLARRRKTVRQLAFEAGLGETDKPVKLVLSDDVIDRIAQLSPTAARRFLLRQT